MIDFLHLILEGCPKRGRWDLKTMNIVVSKCKIWWLFPRNALKYGHENIWYFIFWICIPINVCRRRRLKQCKCKTHFMVIFTLLSPQMWKETEEKSNVRPYQFNATARIRFLIGRFFIKMCNFCMKMMGIYGMHNTKPHKNWITYIIQ